MFRFFRDPDPQTYVTALNRMMLQLRADWAAAIADEKQLYQLYHENQQRANQWRSKAEIAAEREQLDLAREALVRMLGFQARAKAFKQRYDQQSGIVLKFRETAAHLEQYLNKAYDVVDWLKKADRLEKSPQTRE
jgi:phage shock protein A